MRKKVIVKGPILSRSGYGEQARFALRSLRAYEDRFDIYIAPTGWGQLSWTWEDDDERRWIDSVIEKTVFYTNNNQDKKPKDLYDISVQVTIPNEWTTDLAKYNVGYTAGIETDRVSPLWITKAIEMDKIIVVSNHAKNTYLGSAYTVKGRDEVAETEWTLRVDPELEDHPLIEAVNYPVKKTDSVKFEYNFSTKFNFLTMAHWGPRKNLESTIGWFLEEFKDNEDVGLVIKTAFKNTSIIDRERTKKYIERILKVDSVKDRKCKIYLIHGDMTEEEINGLYQHRDIKSFINLAHGEGFGLPIFEAAYHKIPVVAMGWSGQVDFLYAPEKNKKNKKGKKSKNKMVPYFAKVNHKIGKVKPEAVWKTVIEEESCWAYPVEKSYKLAMRDVYDNYKDYKKMSVDLDKYIRSKFTNENQYKQFANAVYEEKDFDVENWLDSLGEEVFE